MSLAPSTDPKVMRFAASLARYVYGACWAVGLIFGAVPLWGVGLVLTKLGNLCIMGGNTIRAKLEAGADRL